MSDYIQKIGLEIAPKIDEKAIQESTSSLTSAFDSVKPYLLGAFSIGAIKKFGENVVEGVREVEQFKQGLYLTGVEGGDAIEHLIGNARDFNFDVKDVVNITKDLMNVTGGVASENDKLLQSLGNIRGETGKSIQPLVDTLQNASLKGAIPLEKVMMMIGKDFPLLANSLKPFRNELGQATVSSEDLKDAIFKATSEGGFAFGGLGKEANTVNDLLGNLGQESNRTFYSIINGLQDGSDAFKPFLQGLLNIEAFIMGNFKHAFAIFGAVASVVFYKVAIPSILTMTKGLWGAVFGANGLNFALGNIMKTFAPMLIIAGLIEIGIWLFNINKDFTDFFGAFSLKMKILGLEILNFFSPFAKIIEKIFGFSISESIKKAEGELEGLKKPKKELNDEDQKSLNLKNQELKAMKDMKNETKNIVDMRRQTTFIQNVNTTNVQNNGLSGLEIFA